MEVIFADGTLITLWPLGVIVLAIGLISAWRRTRRFAYVICAAVFGFYLLLALHFALFPIRLIDDFVGARLTINLIPFNFDFSDISGQVLPQLVENVLLTVPFGFGVNFVAQVRARRMVWLAIGVGLMLEAAQVVISLLVGYPYRVIDINDVLLNALGVLIGYGIFRVFAWVIVRIGMRWLGYVYEVAQRVSQLADG